MEFFHPETVKMKDSQRNAPFQHSINKTHNRLFIIIGSKRSGKPESKCPWCRKRRFSGESGIALQNLFHGGTIDDKVIQLLSGNRKFYLCHLLCGYLKGHFSWMVDKDAVSFVCQVKRDVLIRLLCTGTPVFIPDIHRLPVLCKSRKTLSKTINLFSTESPSCWRI